MLSMFETNSIPKIIYTITFKELGIVVPSCMVQDLITVLSFINKIL